MTYVNQTLPTPPTIHDIRRTVIDPVQVLTNGTYEYRIRRQRFEKFSWEIPTQTMSNEDKETFRAFFNRVTQNGLNAFNFVDPELSNVVDAPLSFVSGTTWSMNFGNVTTGTPVAGNHPTFFNVRTVPSIVVSLDGFPIAASSWTYQLTNGLPTITVTGSNAGSDITVTGTIPFIVRLDSSWSDVLTALDCNNSAIFHNVNSIKLMEVYGEQ